MGKLIAIGQGQVVLTLCKASQGVNIINGVVNVLINVDENNNIVGMSYSPTKNPKEDKILQLEEETKSVDDSASKDSEEA